LHTLSDYEIREARKTDAEDIAYVHLTTWKTNYKGIIAQAYLDNLSLKDRLDLRQKILDNNAGIHLVATFKNKVIAFYDADHFRFHENQRISSDQLKRRNEKGEIYAIYILQEHQHVGIGSDLFQVGRNRLKEKGLIPFVAWVLKENHLATSFYEKMGGKLVDEVKVIIGGSEYLELAYRFEG